MTDLRRKTDASPPAAPTIERAASNLSAVEKRAATLLERHLQSLNLVIEQSKRIALLEQENVALYKLAYFDKLTGLPNQRLLEKSFEEAVNKKAQIVLVFIDLNRFKEINDKYGHAIGDEALKAASEALLSLTRSTDIVAHIDDEPKDKNLPVRYAGDEFIILFTGATADELHNKIAEIKDTFAKLTLKLGKEYGYAEIPVGASIGLYERKEGDDLETCKKRADTAMYKDKQAGKAEEAKALLMAANANNLNGAFGLQAQGYRMSDKVRNTVIPSVTSYPFSKLEIK